jgi:hypothetical protein
MLSIRTQDRMALVPYDSAICIYERQTNELDIILQRFKKEPKDLEKLYEYALAMGRIEVGLVLGTYATKERALEVLDEIQEAILSANMYVGDGIVIEKTPPQEVVYQMPNE